MPIDPNQCRKLLDAADLDGLFIEGLGWDRHKATLEVVGNPTTFRLSAVAQKRGFSAFLCHPTEAGRVPNPQERVLIDRAVTRSAREHLIIYVNGSKSQQLWQWVRRGAGRPVARREYEWRKGQPTGMLLERVLPTLAFGLDEEAHVQLLDVTTRTAVAFDVERVTKRFFERFQQEHTAFHKFVDGITDKGDRDWYASVMLNRMMFCYFIQKKGLLDGDHDYLRNRLSRLQQAKGKDKFWSFYRHFLLRLFHEGLSLKPNQRARELDALIGRIPYLNGGLFLPHDLEVKYKGEIQIPDKAFERIFSFFDEFRWHLDERPLRESNEINPDVLGYIFEKYINQKQMGAYYTKEDITGYISQNTIIPFILDQAAKNCAVAFRPPEEEHAAGSVWRLLKSEPDRYIYAAVRHGVIDAVAAGVSFPKEIAAGIPDVSKRGAWNKPAPQPFALPTETWREYVARRQRCLDLRRMLAAGEVLAVNDLVTLNLDIRQFAEDVIDNCEGPELLRAIWKAVESVTVLDPTCGSGAFLFAALNVLEPLYDACLERMGWFIDSLARDAAAGGKPHPEKYADFRKVLGRVAEHPNRRYFILKSIVVNNLFGVDIMEEACEICKLRLFLKLVAQVEEGAIEKIEPLPDIDFNIRAGNTLVGFTTLDTVRDSLSGQLDFGKSLDRITDQAEQAAAAFRLFREMQTNQGVTPGELSEGKRQLRHQLDGLKSELDRYLAADFHVGESTTAVARWAKIHQSFHWPVDFYSIMAGGGFDVVIGNPPYVGASQVQYLHPGDRASGIPDLYGLVLLRSQVLTKTKGRCGMIVPLSLCFSEDFASVRRALTAKSCSWYSSFDNIPAALFAGVSQRCTIWLGHIGQGPWHATTALQRWRSATRAFLFGNLAYTAQSESDVGRGIPRLGGTGELSLARAIATASKGAIGLVVPPRKAKHILGFAPAARNFMSAFVEAPPCLDAESLKPVTASDTGGMGLIDEGALFAALAVFVGEVHFWHWLTYGDGFHVTVGTVSQFVECVRGCDEVARGRLAGLGRLLHQRRFEALVFKKNAGKYVGNFNYRGHAAITRRADLLLLHALGFGRTMADDVFGRVQRLLAINESAGEKAIPPELKARFPALKVDVREEARLFRDVDAALVRHFGYSEAEFAFLVNEDVAYRRGSEGEE